MTPRAGKAQSLVSPATPVEAEAADNADPGEIAQMKADQAETKSGKYGSEKTKPYKPGEGEEQEQSWIEIELIDEEDKPVPGMPFEVTLPDGSVYSGTLDHNGFYRVDGIPPGECKVSFPTLDEEAWEKA